MSTALNVVSTENLGLVVLSDAAVTADVTGNTFANDGNTFLYLDGGTAGGTVTVKSNLSLHGGLTVPDKIYTLAASKTYIINPSEFVLSIVSDPIKVTASVATIKLAAFH
jgi:hypothetical protein